MATNRAANWLRHDWARAATSYALLTIAQVGGVPDLGRGDVGMVRVSRFVEEPPPTDASRERVADRTRLA